MPAFFGMAPSFGTASMPAPYQGDHRSSQSSSASGEAIEDLDQALNVATKEWDDIWSALHTFHSMLGSRFQPLSAEHQQPLATPFGPALFYRSYDVSGLWAIYNMTMMVAVRSKPSMPPHAHAAAGVAAGDTRLYALEVGRIAAGLLPPMEGEPISPLLGAAFCEVCVPLFFAGVQYREPAQREWVVNRLTEIEQRCGYVNAGTIASGCQTAWDKAYRAGRGPPYVKQYRAMEQDERLNGKWQELGMNGPGNDDDPNDRRNVRTQPAARLHWAMGIIGTEEDE